MMIGGLAENADSRALLTSSVKYYQDDMTFCVSNAGPAPSWMNVFAIFDMGTWMFAIALLNLTGYLLWKFSAIEHTSQGNLVWGLLRTLAITLATYAQWEPRRFPIRFYFLCLMIYGMHFNVAYQSFLITVLTRPRYKAQITSLEMAVAESFHFRGSENTYNFFVSNMDTNPLAKYVVQHFEICEDIDRCLHDILSDPTLAVAVSREHSENSPLMKVRNMFCFPRTHNIYNFLISVLARRDHHILARMNRNIRSILEAGLLVKWQKDSQHVAMGSDEADKSAGGDAEGSGQIVLRLDHVQGAFFVGSIGLTLALVVFILEWAFYVLTKSNYFKNRLRSMELRLCYN